MKSACGFCGSQSGKITNEHIFGEWIGRLFGAGSGSGKLFEHETGENWRAIRAWSAVTLDIKVKMACGACNHGWMSDLEKVVEPIVTPMVFGKRRVLSLKDQVAISSWALKICMVQEWMHNDQRFFSADDRQALMNYAIPTDLNARIWAGRFSDPNRGVYGVHTTLSQLSSGLTIAYLATFAVGEFSLQVLVERFATGGLERAPLRPGPWDEALIRIWPPSRFADIDPRGLVWPPGISFTEKGFHELYERFAPFGSKGTRDSTNR